MTRQRLRPLGSPHIRPVSDRAIVRRAMAMANLAYVLAAIGLTLAMTFGGM